MQTETKVVVIGLDELNTLLKQTIAAEVQAFKAALQETHHPKGKADGRYRIRDVADFLGICTRTVREHCKRGYFPEPNRDAVGKPFWTQEQLDEGIKLRQFQGKYPV